MRLVFAGAAHEVTGACFYLEDKEHKFLVDCGLFQGSKLAYQKNIEAFPFLASEIDFVLLTHAHLDHCGRLPRLVRLGFSGPIFATPPTVAIARLVLEDTLGLMLEGSVPKIFEEEDLKETLNRFVEVGYNTSREINHLSFTFREAGHILGSSFLEIESEKHRLLFSGDLGNAPSLLLSPPDKPFKAETLILEATYGDREHDDKMGKIAFLHEAVDYVIRTGGTLLIPAFAVERTQELLFIFDILSAHAKISKIPIYLDSPLAIDVVSVFRSFPDYLRPAVADKVVSGDDPFDFPSLRLVYSEALSKTLNDKPGPRIIIAGSGMMEGGRIQHHLVHLLDDPRNMLFVPCFQAKGTLGRQIIDGAKEVTIFNKTLPVKAKVVFANSFSSHADQPQILKWLEGQSPKRIFCVHGEEEGLLALKSKLEKQFPFAEIIIPSLNEGFEL
jgi:metallo-beta-lactamase family protein